MGKLLAKEREVVVPGQIISEGMDYLPSTGTYRLKEQVIVNRLGILNVDGKVLKVTPLSGRYLPKEGDTVIGKVEDILMSGWRMDINSPYSAVLPLREASFDFIKKGADLSKYFALDDYAVVKITSVTTQNLVDLSAKGQGLRRLRGGRVIKVDCNKVPRIIGKQGSMVKMINDATGCRITVGQNGVVWFMGEPQMESAAFKAIRLIEQEAHTQGLTDRVKALLDELTKDYKGGKDE